MEDSHINAVEFYQEARAIYYKNFFFIIQFSAINTVTLVFECGAFSTLFAKIVNCNSKHSLKLFPGYGVLNVTGH